jgi:hypothetical protein
MGLATDQGDDLVGPGRGGAPRPFAFAGRRAGAGGHRRTRRFAGEGNTGKRPPKHRVPEDRNADFQRPVDEGRLKLIREIYRLATGQVELIGWALDRVSRIGRPQRQRGGAAWSSLKCAAFAIDFRDRLRQPASHRLSRRPRPFGERYAVVSMWP